MAYPFSSQDPGAGEQLLRKRELAKRWKISIRTLERWQADGFGPRWLLLGGSVRYRLSDVIAYEDAQSRGGQS
ncbi:DNA-binding protein [Oceanicola sp. D3]|uniref:helix-turn-helix transcriptional regulator n=1 Tax=Oceanicola sp. D3 TaxID=2587163 RepID=UPI001123188B|nr:DNA-binding protein [Oceanicola sp. D3]QDC10093.1 DNA-binding protein [Oceanicola sp. D3]